MLIAIGGGVVVSSFPQYLRYRIAMDMNVTLPVSGGDMNRTCVGRNTGNLYYTRLQEIQAEVAYWHMIQSLCGYLPSLFISPILGAWSDVIGRKVFMGLSVFGFVLFGVMYLLVYHLMLPIWVIAASFTFAGNFHILSQSDSRGQLNP